MEAAIRPHFFNHGLPESDPEEERNCHWCQIRSFATHKTIPITIVNGVDDKVLNPNFRFIDHSILSEDVPVADTAFRAGCECPNDKDCMYDTCHCLDEVDDDSYDDEDDSVSNSQQRRKCFAYYSSGAKAGLLRDKILHTRVPIYECHELCRCSLNCPNRVVQRGRTVPLQIFRTDERGWGVKCPVNIRKGQFVDRYLGEIITDKEANRRRNESVMAQRKDVYLFALDKFFNEKAANPDFRKPPMEVDGEWMSGPTRFINHSCDPNMRIFARVGDHTDKNIHDLALFAIKDILAGEELTFDYVDASEEGENDAIDPAKTKDMTKCGAATGSARAINEPPQNNGQSSSQTGVDEPNLAQSSRRRRRHSRQPLDQHINKPLRRHQWTSHDRQWTPAALRRERIDFFDTRVTGRQEIWQTLHTALEVLWKAEEAARNSEMRQRRSEDEGPSEEDPAIAMATAQSILDAADITLPTGDLYNGAYDALGNYYQLPHQIVADPVNLLWAPGSADDDLDLTANEETERDFSDDEAERRREEKGKAVVDIRDQIIIRARLSDGSRDISVVVDKSDSVRRIARLIAEEAKLSSGKKVRLAYMGKILQDGPSLSDQGWKQGHIVNALVFNR
ncbi:hypothetical protein N0V88_002826 [Collariella sp. IMI 366227]|nr:hypothetical protein N0V88_002826 [Collariella sp. IMI 366227]